MSKTIENLKKGNYSVVDNQGVSVTEHFIDCLEKELADLETKLADLQQEQIAEMQEHQEAMQVADNTIKSLEDKLAESESRFQAHKQNDARIIQDQTDLIENLKQQLAESEEFLVATKWKVQDLNKQFADTETQNKRVLEKLELIVSANQELEQKLAESEELVKDLEFRNKNLEHSLKVAPNANAGQRARIVELKEINHKLKQQLAEKEKENTNLQLMLDKILTEIHTNCYSGLNIVHFKEMALNDLGEVVITHNQDKISFTVEQLEKVKELLKSFDGNHNGSIDCCETDILNIIDNQIKQLKEMK